MSERAAPWGVKRRSWAAARTRRRVSSRTGPESCRARETVATDTRAARATSRIVAWRGPSGCRLRGDFADTPRLDRRLGVNGYSAGGTMSRKQESGVRGQGRKGAAALRACGPLSGERGSEAAAPYHPCLLPPASYLIRSASE